LEGLAKMLNRNSQDVLDNGTMSQNKKYAEFCESHEACETYLQKLLADIFNMNPHFRKTDYLKDAETLHRRYVSEGLSFATKTLPALWDGLLAYLETGESRFPGFRIAKGQKYPVFLRQLFEPIFRDPECACSVTCMECLFQFCVAFKKLKGPYKQGVLVEQLDEFVKVDQSLNNDWLEYETILSKARNIIRQVCENLDPFNPDQAELFLPRPGPGATNSPTKKHERYRPHVSYAQLSDVFNYEEWFSSVPFSYRGMKPLIIAGEDLLIGLKKSNTLTSRFKFVHKTFGKPRCICIEQFETQWLQQGIRKALYEVVERHPLTKDYVRFTDQSVNGRLALLSSVDRQYSTIDMSSASDRVGRELVAHLFQDNQAFLKALMTLSTRVIELPFDVPFFKKYVLAQKFAPMGSAICFPIMGLVHFALIKSIISMSDNRHINDIPVWVYGDDIIIEREHSQLVFDLLPKFGMKLNKGKSFVNSNFRESCGVNAYLGKDITPVRFKSIVHNPLSINDVVTALQNEYVLDKRGYKNTASFIRSELLSYKQLRASAFPVVGSESPVLGWIRDQGDASIGKGYHSLRRRWMPDLQRYHYKARVIVDLLDDCPPISDCEYYLRKQVTFTRDARKIDGSPKGLSIRWRWLPDSAFCRY